MALKGVVFWSTLLGGKTETASIWVDPDRGLCGAPECIWTVRLITSRAMEWGTRRKASQKTSGAANVQGSREDASVSYWPGQDRKKIQTLHQRLTNPFPCQCFPPNTLSEWENTDPAFSFPVGRRNFNYKANCWWSAPGSVCGGLEPMKKRLLFIHSFTRTPSF